MSLALATILLGAGLTLLFISGEAVVLGVRDFSTDTGLSHGLAGALLVGIGTSSPELVASIEAVLGNRPGIAIGNVIGSNIANILLVGGVAILYGGLSLGRPEIRRHVVWVAIATLALILFSLIGGIRPWHGLVLAALFAFYVFRLFRAEERKENHHQNGHQNGQQNGNPDVPRRSRRLYVPIFLAGLAGLAFGAELTVKHAAAIAHYFGTPPLLVGLSVVALGTSLPELATAVSAMRRRHTDAVLGNIMGSCVFNLLLILGVASWFAPAGIPATGTVYDQSVLALLALVLMSLAFQPLPLARFTGLLSLALYGGYIASVAGRVWA